MKKIKFLLVCAAILLLAGCTNATIWEQEQEKWQMNETMMQMIQDAVGCDARRAKAMLEIFQDVNMPEPVGVSVQDADNSCIVVETADGGQYQVKINKKHYVYFIQNLVTGENLYMVLE